MVTYLLLYREWSLKSLLENIQKSEINTYTWNFGMCVEIFDIYDGGLLVCGMYPTSFFPRNTLKINGFATNQENPRTSSPLLIPIKLEGDPLTQNRLLIPVTIS